MQLSLRTSLPAQPATQAAARPSVRLAGRGREAAGTPRPAAEAPATDAPRPKKPLARVAQAAERAQRRVRGTIDESTLTERQSQALDKVQRRFERMTGRLQQAVESGGADRAGLHDGLDKVYGRLREALTDILAAGDGLPVADRRLPAELTGLTLDRTA